MNGLCPNCGTGRNRPAVVATCARRGLTEEFAYRRCDGCGLVFLPDADPATIAARIYDCSYEDEWGDSRGLKQKIEHWLVKRLPRHAPGRLLDIGCGTGAYLRHAEAQGWTVQGVDPWSHRYRRALHPAVLPVDIAEAGLADASFDVVTMWWVIEHYADPLAKLAEAARVLKRDGLFVLSTCNIDSYEARLFGRYWHHLLPPEHICHFNPANLSQALERSGFQVQAVKHVPLTAGVMGSLRVMALERGWPLTFSSPAWNVLGLPFEMAAAALRNSGLFVVYCSLKPLE